MPEHHCHACQHAGDVNQAVTIIQRFEEIPEHVIADAVLRDAKVWRSSPLRKPGSSAVPKLGAALSLHESKELERSLGNPYDLLKY